MFERRHHPLLPLRHFIWRLFRTLLVAAGIVFVALGIGILGYHHFEGFSWLDSLHNAAMILTGMGPVNPVRTVGGKLFASGYALFSGMIFLSVAAVLFAPVAHRLIHRFHLELLEEDKDDGTTGASRASKEKPTQRSLR